MDANSISRWINKNRRRIFLFIGLIPLPFLLIIRLPDTISWFMSVYIFRNLSYDLPVYIASAFIAIIFVSFFWFISGALQGIADSLGYSASINHDIALKEKMDIAYDSISSASNEIESAVLAAPLEKYDNNNALSALDLARLRLLDHISNLRNNSVTNLFIGIGIALGGLTILGIAVFQAANFIDPGTHALDVKNYTLSALLPKLSVTLFVQIFSYFFLAMYRSNQSDIRFFQNEITLIDSLATAVVAAQLKTSGPNMKLVLTALSKNERNRVMKKGEKVLSSTDEIELMHAMSILTQISKIRKEIDE